MSEHSAEELYAGKGRVWALVLRKEIIIQYISTTLAPTLTHLHRISILIAVLLIALCMPSCTQSPRATPPDEILDEVRAVSKLELIEQLEEEIMVIKGNKASLSSIASLDDLLAYLDSFLRVGSRVGVYAYTHHYTAYIDLSRIESDAVQIDKAQHRVRICLPRIEVELSGRSGQIQKLHERVTGTQPLITQEDRSRLQEAALQRIQARMKPGDIRYDSLVSRAKVQARAYFTGLLHSRGYTIVEIQFEDQSTEAISHTVAQ